MQHFLQIFLFTFLGVGFVNQMFYNFCFSSRCLSAAFPKVLLLSLIVAAVIYLITRSETKAE